MKIAIALVIGIALCSSRIGNVAAQRQQAQYCVTPDNYYGQCVALTYCPQVVQYYQNPNRNAAQQYIIALQRACGVRSINRDPVVCCTQLGNQQQPTTTVPSRNPFFPTNNNNDLTTTSRNVRTPQTTRPTAAPRRTNAPRTTTTTPRATTQSAQLIEPRGTACKTPQQEDGVCIDLTNCQLLVEELYQKQNDATFANYLRTSNRQCGGVGSTVCCPSTGGGGGGPVTQRPVNPVTPGSGGRFIRPANTGEVPRRLLTPEEGCGHSDNTFRKIVGGDVSRKGAWPWIALIGYTDDGFDSPFKCGGTLVTARHVVTAAHCLRNDLEFVRLGEHDLTTDTEARHVDIPVVRAVAHPQYTPKNGRSDVAVLYLQRNVEFTDNIAPICMPISEQLRRKSYVRYTPFVVGWGKTQERGVAADVLQELQIPVYDNEVCRESYARQNRNFTLNQFDGAVLCAGVLSGGKDTCQGDSGGPLMIPEPYSNNVRYYLIGVVSYGIGCARPNVPGVYSSVQYFMDWIEEQIRNTN